MLTGLGWRDIRDSRKAGRWACTKENTQGAPARTCANRVVARFRGKHTLLAFLDCSKCYEHVGRRLAGRRAIASGLQSRVANVITDMQIGARHTKAHGALATPRRGNHGPVAGCAFATDILQAFMAAVKEKYPEGKPRDHVVDVTLRPAGCAARMREQLEKLKRAPRMDNCDLNHANSRWSASQKKCGAHGNSMGKSPRLRRT